MDLKLITSLEDAKKAFPVMSELRTHLTESSYLELLQTAQSAGYKLVGVFEDERCLALMGYRILIDFVHGKHLYIDDLVVTSNARSKGLGARLLDQAKKIAAESGCARLRLCTGVDNEDGKKFYSQNGWDLKAVVYKMKIQRNSDQRLI